MNHTDLELGKVLVTGEIAFYMKHSKGRRITLENKSKFLQKWISKKIRGKRYSSDVRKSLQLIRKQNKCADMWTRQLHAYLQHIETCKKIKKGGKTDRELVEECIEEMSNLGFHAKSQVSKREEFTDAEIYRFHKMGAFLLMDILENRFDENGMMEPNSNLDFISTNQEVKKMAVKVFLKKSFPLKCSDREDIFTVGSPSGQINTSLSSINK